jgi:subtilisin family serine protease
VTGKNVTTAIMDDGVDYMHPDLINNFVSFLHDKHIFNVYFSFLLVYWCTRMNYSDGCKTAAVDLHIQKD